MLLRVERLSRFVHRLWHRQCSSCTQLSAAILHMLLHQLASRYHAVTRLPILSIRSLRLYEYTVASPLPCRLCSAVMSFMLCWYHVRHPLIPHQRCISILKSIAVFTYHENVLRIHDRHRHYSLCFPCRCDMGPHNQSDIQSKINIPQSVAVCSCRSPMQLLKYNLFNWETSPELRRHAGPAHSPWCHHVVISEHL
jgi:hypothetical protein